MGDWTKAGGISAQKLGKISFMTKTWAKPGLIFVYFRLFSKQNYKCSTKFDYKIKKSRLNV